jgi:hypothetical protein
MRETVARIGQDGTIELVDEKMVPIAGTAPMTPSDAAFLARSLLSCAALISIEKSAKIGTLCADAHFPVLKWTITAQTETRKPIIIFSIPPGLDLTFQMSPQDEKKFGAALIAHSEGLPPPQRPPDLVH